MIKITTTGTLPTLPNNPIPDTMREVAELMERSIQMNFLMSGRPTAWTPLKNGGETPLVRTGAMMRNISSNFGAGFAEAGMLNIDKPYYWIHQMGGWTGKGHKAYIPARPYVLFQEQDKFAILEAFRNAIMKGVHSESIH